MTSNVAKSFDIL